MNAYMLHWAEPQPVDIPDEMDDILPGGKIFAELLVRRGIKTRSQALAFLYPEHYQQSDPFDFPNMLLSVNILRDHIAANKKIAIWGDFDADGQTATAILYEGIKKITQQIIYQIPVRIRESHGVSLEGVKGFIDNGVDLMITCDTGITEHKAIEFAREHGLCTIITDHHALPEKLPEADATINPEMLPTEHPMRSLSGAGVAYQFLRAIYQKMNQQDEIEHFLDLAAIGIIADLVPLIGEARYLARKGILSLKKTQRPGLLELYKRAKITKSNINEETISFSLAPRMNSLGRLGDANPVIELLTTRDKDIAIKLVDHLEKTNVERKLVTGNITNAAIHLIEQEPNILDKPVIILDNTEWPTGVIGVVASHLSDLYHKPVIIIATPHDKIARGSARSIEGINIIDAISEHKHHLTRFGGHPLAAGFSIEPQKITDFKRDLLRTIGQKCSADRVEPKLLIDAFLPLEISTGESFEKNLELFGPFGPENPRMNFCAEDLQILDVLTFGKSMNHRRINVKTPSSSQFNILWWNGAFDPLPANNFDLVYQINPSTYRGQKTAQITVVAFRPGEAIETRKGWQPLELEIHDRRVSQRPLEEINYLLETDKFEVFAEGLNTLTEGITTKNRLEISPGGNLIILTSPPAPEILTQVIQKAKPKIVHVFAFEPDLGNKIKFMKYLTDRLLQCIQKNNGNFDIRQIAAESGHIEKTILRAVEFLAYKTSLEILAVDEFQIKLGNFGKPQVGGQFILEDLDRLLEETAAFRRYFQRVDLNKIFRNVEIGLDHAQNG